VGAAVTDVSLVVVVVVVAGSVVQDDKAMAQAGITGIRRISFFIVDLMLTMDSPPVVPTDGLRASFFQARAIGTFCLVPLETAGCLTSCRVPQ
jgi:hypothetical protein